MDEALLRRAVGLGALAGLLLGAASPAGLFPGAALLVLPGLALLLQTACLPRRAGAGMFVAGAVLFTWLTWSLRFVTILSVALIPLLAGLYVVGVGALLRRWRARFGDRGLPFVFALFWPLFEWIRTVQPEIPYPHGQVAHALYHWPALLLPVRVLGEPDMNALLCMLAGALWCLCRRQARSAAAVAATAILIWGGASLPLRDTEPDGARLRVALVQTGIPIFPDEPAAEELRRIGLVEHYRRLVRRVAADADLVIWPESTITTRTDQRLYDDERLDARLAAYARSLAPGRDVVFGGALYPVARGPGSHWNAAFVVGADGDVRGRREKVLLVPAGEMVPILRWLLPAAWFDGFLDALRGNYAFVPDLLFGRELPLPTLSDGRAVGVTICFENAFPGLFAAMAQAGASLFCVLSNEGWYRAGPELDQMLAMTVFRALETGRPVLRSTIDGYTGWVDPAGRIRGLVPLEAAEVLAAEVQPRRGSRVAMGWGGWLVPALALLAVILLWIPKKGRGPARGGATG